MNEDKYYSHVLDVTKLIRQKELKIGVILLVVSAISAAAHYLWLPDRVYLLLPVVFFGLAVASIFKRDQDVKLGGLSSYALMLYYTLDNAWLVLHFIAMNIIGVPIVFWLTRHGYIGPLALYALTILLLPVSAISYGFFSQHFHYQLIHGTFSAEEVIYIFLPLIYIHTSLTIKRKQYFKESFYYLVLLVFGAALWVGVDRLFG